MYALPRLKVQFKKNPENYVMHLYLGQMNCLDV